jgi:ADP-heptose:LPS heptosyltransferase
MRSDNLFNLGIDIFQFIIWCRRKKITAVIDLELFSRFTALLTGLSGARTRIGFATFHDEGMYRGSLINFPVRYNPHVHISINFVSLVNKALNRFDNPYATVPVKEEEPVLENVKITSESRSVVLEKIKTLYPEYSKEKIILLNANASDFLPQRRWLPEYFISTGKALLEKFNDILLIATGAPKEREYVQKVVNGIDNEKCVNSAGVFEFEELVPLYAISDAMLTNDSGPAHFASVTSLKIFVIFGPETPTLYGPLGDTETFYLGLPCSPCVSAANHRKTTCLTRPCVTGIKPEWVQEKMFKYISHL